MKAFNSIKISITLPFQGDETSLLWISTILLVVLFGFLVLYFKLKKENQILTKKVSQKETLLKEVHHRVKNNLQTVSSLLNLQSKLVHDQAVQQLIKSSQQRVVSMAMVHEMLYSTEEFSSEVNIKAYLEQLLSSLFKSNHKDERLIKRNFNIEELTMDIDTAIPVGLIVNEIITNAIKYAVIPERDLEISICLSKPRGNEFLLEIGDNGPGYPAELNAKKTNSLGLKLIYNLTRQLRGTVERNLTKQGTHYVISFRGVQGEFLG